MKVQSLQESPSNGSGSWSLGLELLFVLKTLPIASANAVASASWELDTGVSSSAGLRCADPRCVDMLAGVGGCVGGWVMGFEFPELLSSTVPARIELWVIQRLIKQVVGRDVQIYVTSECTALLSQRLG